MHDVPKRLVLHRHAELGRPLGGRVEVHVHLAVDLGARLGVLVEHERDHVGFVVVPEPLAVEVVDERVARQHDAERREPDALARAHGLDHGADAALVEAERVVLLVDLEGVRAVWTHASGDQSPSKSGSLSDSTTAACATSGATVRKSAESRRSETLA